MLPNSPIDAALRNIPRSAEELPVPEVAATTVEYGDVFVRLRRAEHQLVFGRPGMGKTHAFLDLQHRRRAAGDLVAYVDLRRVGSTTHMQRDPALGAWSPALDLFRDIMRLAVKAVQPRGAGRLPGGRQRRVRDELLRSLDRIEVVGETEITESSHSKSESSGASRLSAELSLRPKISANVNANDAESVDQVRTVINRGAPRPHLNFSEIGTALQQYVEATSGKRLWILLDDFHDFSTSTQPLLADLFRRALFGVPAVTVKIAAVERRAKLAARDAFDEDLGISIGLSQAARVSLDDELMELNTAERIEWISSVVRRHTWANLGRTDEPIRDARPGSQTFHVLADHRAAETLYLASAASPRSSLELLNTAGLRPHAEPLNAAVILEAARVEFLRIKAPALAAQRLRTAFEWLARTVLTDTGQPLFRVRADAEHTRQFEGLAELEVISKRQPSHRLPDEQEAEFELWQIDLGYCAAQRGANDVLEIMDSEGSGRIPIVVPGHIPRHQESGEPPTASPMRFGRVALPLDAIAPQNPADRLDPIAARLRPGRYLIVLGSEDEPDDYIVPLSGEWLRIGRSLAADVRFDDASVSRRHAVIANQSDGVRIIDDKSLNGVLVNGVRVDWSFLQSGDIAVIGTHRLAFIEVPAPESS